MPDTIIVDEFELTLSQIDDDINLTLPQIDEIEMTLSQIDNINLTFNQIDGIEVE